jgi:hypothetical protein
MSLSQLWCCSKCNGLFPTFSGGMSHNCGPLDDLEPAPSASNMETEQGWHLKTREDVLKELKKINSDERFHYDPANVFSNAPLALIQVNLEAIFNSLCWVLGISKEEAVSLIKDIKHE